MDSDTDRAARDRADAGEAADPHPRRRHKPLDTLERVRRELSAIYYAAKTGSIELDRAKGLTYLLSQIAAVLKAETASEPELAALVQQVRDKLAR